jgi:hypothetical protein
LPTAAITLLGEKISLPRASISTTCVCGATAISKYIIKTSVKVLVATILLGNVVIIAAFIGIRL